MLHSPTPHLLGTRSKPNDTERSAILDALHVQQDELRRANSHVVTAEATLARLDKEWEYMVQYVYEDSCPQRNAIVQVVGEIDEAQRTLSRAITRRNEVQRFVDGHSAIITPLAQWLLQDVLSEVFLTLVHNVHYTSSSYKRGALALSQVCRHWRNVAFSTPLLWNSFADHKLRLQFTEFWLGNSGTSPLTLSLLPSDKLDQSLLSLYTTYRSRWKEFSISLPIFLLSTLNAVPHETPNDVGWLESLNIDVVPSRKDLEYHSAESFQWLTSIVRVAPRLRRLSWTGPVVVNGILWSQLTHIKLATTTVTLALNILGEATNVQHFTAGLSAEELESESHRVAGKRIRLGSLLNLDVMFHRALRFQVNKFFAPLELPALRELQICCPSYWPHEGITNLLIRSNCTPEDFTIFDGGAMECTQLIQLFRHPALSKCIIRIDVTWCSKPPPHRATGLATFATMVVPGNLLVQQHPPPQPHHHGAAAPSNVSASRLLPSGLKTVIFYGPQVPVNHSEMKLQKSKLRYGNEEFPVYLDMAPQTQQTAVRYPWDRGGIELAMLERDGMMVFECV